MYKIDGNRLNESFKSRMYLSKKQCIPVKHSIYDILIGITRILIIFVQRFIVVSFENVLSTRVQCQNYHRYTTTIRICSGDNQHG